MNTQAFKSYSSKSAAAKGASRANFDVDKIEQVDGKWGFYPVAEKQEQDPPLANEAIAIAHEVLANMQAGETTQSEAPAAVFPCSMGEIRADGELAAALEKGIEEAESEEEETPIVPDAFGAFASAQLGAQQPAADPVRTQAVIRVEKNRAERNGVKQPSSGTACANVWDLAFKLSDMSESTQGQHERIATLSQVVKAAEAAGINKFTARTQYARWRVFHGLTGRLVQK